MSRGRRRRIAVVTGTRAEYGALRSTLRALAGNPHTELQLIVGGLHLLPRFGRTERLIRNDGFRIALRAAMQSGDDAPDDQALGVARGVSAIARFLVRRQTDMVVVLGDRIEALAAAVAAVTTGRVLAHIHGGDVAPGDFDDSLRHAITKLAHLHLAATRRSAERIVRMGEDRCRVHVVGAPGLDELRPLLRNAPRSRERRALIVYHPVGRSPSVERLAMQRVLTAAARAGLARTIIYPNSDRGHTGIVEAIERHAAHAPRGEVAVHRSLPREQYLNELLRAAVLIGNSSSGILEAPLAGTPAVDVGDRQRGREPGGPSIVHCGESAGEIRRAIHAALRLRPRRGAASVYGDGRSGARIASVLSRVKLDDELRRKGNAY